MTQFEINDTIGGIVSVVMLALPYSIFFIKKGGLSPIVKLLFISLAELLMLLSGAMAVYITQSDVLAACLFPFSIYIELVVTGNFVLMAFLWLMKKAKPKELGR